jgi:hypothetical protein
MKLPDAKAAAKMKKFWGEALGTSFKAGARVTAGYFRRILAALLASPRAETVTLTSVTPANSVGRRTIN